MTAEAPAVYNIAAATPDDTDASPLGLALLRDLLIATVGVGLIFGAYAWSEATPFAYGGGVGGVIAAIGGFIVYTVLHEWGHYLGAKLTGGHAPRTALSQPFPLFHFDMDRSTATQAAAVGIGGTVVLLLLVVLAWGVFEDGSPVATGLRLLAVYGLVGTAFIEWPIIADTIRRGDGAAAWHAYLEVRPFRTRFAAIAALVATLGAGYVGV